MGNDKETNLDKSLRNLLLDGVASQIMFSLVTVSIISSYLASINAEPFIIGFIAAIPFLSQLIQLQSASFVENFSRKKISLLANLISRMSLLLIGIVMLYDSSNLYLFIVFFIFYNVFKEVSAVSWSSWMRDLLPLNTRGEFLARRLAYGKLASLGVILAISVIFSYLGKFAFPIVFLSAFGAGMASLYFIFGIDDVNVEKHGKRSFLLTLRDSNFVKLISGFSIWRFAVEMSLPFYFIYIITILKYPIWVVITLTAVSQLSSAYFLRVSGKITDRYGNKPVLILSFLSFSFAALLFTFTTMPDKHIFTPLILIVVFILEGFYSSVSGLTFLNATTKITQRGSSASYYAISNVISSISAAAGSISGGIIASFLLMTNFAMKIDIESSVGSVEIPAVYLVGYDFLFIVSAAMSLFAAKLLRFFKEEGESSEEVVKKEIKRAVVHDIHAVVSMPYIQNGRFALSLRKPPVAPQNVCLDSTLQQNILCHDSNERA